MLTETRLKFLLDYDPETGIFIHKVMAGGRPVGSRAGTLTPEGYRNISIDGIVYKEHRVAFLWMEGRWPDPECDHRDLDKANNRWTNLRESTRAQNNSNKKLLPSNTSGTCGVYLHKKTNRWCAYIRSDNVNRYLGSFYDKDEAIVARKRAEKIYHGDFAR